MKKQPPRPHREAPARKPSRPAAAPRSPGGFKPSHDLAWEVVTTVRQIFVQGYYADRAISETMHAHKKWADFARRYYFEAVHDLIRNWRYYWFLADLPTHDYLDPEAITEQRVWWVWGTARIMREYNLAPFPELRGMPKTQIAEKRTVRTPDAIYASLPDWLNEAGQAAYGPEWREMAKTLKEPADTHLRVNTLRGNLRNLQDELASGDIRAERIQGFPEALSVEKPDGLFTTAAFKRGLFEVQDAASQRIAPFVEAEQGMRVIDACAGAGGKSLHLAALMHNKGRIIALDVRPKKLQELRRRAARAGADTIESRLIEDRKLLKRMNGTGDRVLIDAPCTGTGALRRNPDIKWKLTAADLERLEGVQRELLRDYSALVKPGGKLIYATCSILPSENENQVRDFLKANGNAWKLEAELRLRPGDHGADGFYAARLVKRA